MELIVDSERKRVRHSGSVGALLRKLGVMREEVVVKVNGKLAPETHNIGARDRVEIIKVVFGG
ncbi:MAG: MoaD/ThiS family protein [Candidatus ainarchaeum sp.]|nr:MoaD/ThiS family protein [Candidatus ainarchaeum sp.]